MSSTLGTLFLIPNTLGDDSRVAQLPWVLPSETISQTAKLTNWIVEDAKTARAFLKAVDSVSPLACSIQEMHMSEWRGAARNAKYGDTVKPADLLKPLLSNYYLQKELVKKIWIRVQPRHLACQLLTLVQTQVLQPS